jgi:hypothetical protein
MPRDVPFRDKFKSDSRESQEESLSEGRKKL